MLAPPGWKLLIPQTPGDISEAPALPLQYGTVGFGGMTRLPRVMPGRQKFQFVPHSGVLPLRAVAATEAHVWSQARVACQPAGMYMVAVFRVTPEGM